MYKFMISTGVIGLHVVVEYVFCHKSMRSYQIDIDIQYRALELLNIHVFFSSVKLSLILVYRPPDKSSSNV